jgi:predicted RNA binding protein YcfA (HicA-like mRNA interferase family)
MKLPRDLGGVELARALARYGYQITRQTGSHLRLTTDVGGEHHVTIPAHPSLRVGTLNAILSEIAQHLNRDKVALIQELWE